MLLEIIVGIIGAAFIVLSIFIIITLQRFRKTAKKFDRILSDVDHLIRSVTNPSVELIDNANKLIVDVKKKSEGLDVLFHPLYSLKRVGKKMHVHQDTLDTVVDWVAIGVSLWKKLKN